MYEVRQLFDARHGAKKWCLTWHRIINAVITRCRMRHRFLTPCLLSKSCWQTSCPQSLDQTRQISLPPGAGGAVPSGRRLTDRGWLCPKPSDVGRGWGPPTSVPPLYPPPDAIPSVLPPYPTLSPQVVWGLNKGNHRSQWTSTWGLVCRSWASDCVYEVCQLFDARHGVKKRCHVWHCVVLALIIRCHVWHYFLTPCLASKSSYKLCNQSLA